MVYGVRSIEQEFTVPVYQAGISKLYSMHSIRDVAAHHAVPILAYSYDYATECSNVVDRFHFPCSVLSYHSQPPKSVPFMIRIHEFSLPAVYSS